MSTTVTLEVPVPVDSLPELVDVKWIATTFGITRRAVVSAISEGYLPARLLGNSYVVDPVDAVRLWGHRLHRRAVNKGNA